ncbi:MAG UNVERIFIED_CONTAM: hypothetical protein LVR18_25140 [Planctomycetaceae bacterium]|jgi:hypothetical protein
MFRRPSIIPLLLSLLCGYSTRLHADEAEKQAFFESLHSTAADRSLLSVPPWPR